MNKKILFLTQGDEFFIENLINLYSNIYFLLKRNSNIEFYFFGLCISIVNFNKCFIIEFKSNESVYYIIFLNE